MSKRAVLLFGVEHAAFARRCAQGANVAGVVFERRSLQLRLNMLTNRLRRMGTWTVLGQLGHRLYRRLLRGWSDGSERIEAGAFPEVLTVGDINSDEVVAFLRKHQPDAVAVYGTSLLRKPLLEALPKDNYNIHTGLTQYYRGVCSSFWALYEDHPERLGVTIHRLSPGIDTGDIVLMAQPPGNMVGKAQTLAEIDRIIAETGEMLLLDLLTGRREPARISPATRGTLYTEPTLWQYLRLQRRTGLW